MRKLKLSLKIMRKSLVIIALLTAGMLSAQSKSDLKKEFEQLEKKIGEANKKFDSKIGKMEKDIGGDREMEDFKIDESDFGEGEEGFGDELEGLDKEGSTEESMKMFVEMYQETKKARNLKDDGSFKKKGKKQSAKEKEYLKIVKEYDDEIAKIEDRMYKVAKKYIEKK